MIMGNNLKTDFFFLRAQKLVLIVFTVSLRVEECVKNVRWERKS